MPIMTADSTIVMYPNTKRFMAQLGFETFKPRTFDNIVTSIKHNPDIYESICVSSGDQDVSAKYKRSVGVLMFLMAFKKPAFLRFFMARPRLLKEITEAVDASPFLQTHSRLYHEAARKYASYLKLRGFLLLPTTATVIIITIPDRVKHLVPEITAEECEAVARLCDMVLSIAEVLGDMHFGGEFLVDLKWPAILAFIQTEAVPACKTLTTTMGRKNVVTYDAGELYETLEHCILHPKDKGLAGLARHARLLRWPSTKYIKHLHQENFLEVMTQDW